MFTTLPQTETRSLSLSMPNLILRLEGLAVFLAAIALYAHQGYSGVAFAALLLVPDLSAIAYRINARVGSIAYNTVHTYAWTILVAGLGLALGSPVALQIALIGFAHIGMDRVLGFGLKYPTVFNDTHFQHV